MTENDYFTYHYFLRKCKKFPVIVSSILNTDFGKNETGTITITGEWFTPDIAVIVENQTVNSINYIDFNTIQVNITSGNTVGNFDIIIAGNKYPGTFKVTSYINLIPGDGTTNWIRTTSNVTTSLGEIIPTVYVPGWNQAGSFGTVPNNKDFTLSFKTNTNDINNAFAMCGVDNSDPDNNYSSIDYAIYFGGGNLGIYENGSAKGNFGTYTIDDTFSINRKADIVTYLKNIAVFYTSFNNSTSPIVFDISIYRYIGFSNIKLRYPE